ncbi:putative methyltransferase [Streptomyces sp. NBRC 110611]|nr:putative methyltransferase [Streptomyces sp. NBRC 110611]
MGPRLAPSVAAEAGAESPPWNGGVHADDLVTAVEPLVTSLQVELLSDNADLWGRAVDDMRYALIAHV